MQPPYQYLSGDDERAFLQLEREFRQSLDEDIRRDGRDPLHAQLAYVNKVLAAAAALGIAPLSHLTRPENPLTKSADNLHQLRDEIDHALVALRLKSARRDPITPRNTPTKDPHRLSTLIDSIAAEVHAAPLPQNMYEEAVRVVTCLRNRLGKQDLRMEHFVELGRMIATMGRQPEMEAVADKCWRWLRIAMDLVGHSHNPRRPFAHLDGGLNGHDQTKPEPSAGR